MKRLNLRGTPRQFVGIVGGNYPNPHYNDGVVNLHKPTSQFGIQIEKPQCSIRGDEWASMFLDADELMRSPDYRPCKKCQAKSPEYFSVEVASYRWETP